MRLNGIDVTLGRLFDGGHDTLQLVERVDDPGNKGLPNIISPAKKNSKKWILNGYVCCVSNTQLLDISDEQL